MADSLGLESGVVRLVEYDARWPALFAAEQQRIRDQCGTLALRLEHVGGTSIPGMCAKPVLDMAAGQPRDTSTQDCLAALEQAGYEHRGERGVPGREFFCRGQPRAYHVHLVEEGGPLWRDYIALRDYLRAHAEAAGLPLQINTTVCGDTAPYLEEMAGFVQGLGIVFWEVFFLIPTGRGSVLTGLSGGECERLFDVIYRVQKKGEFIVKVTEAPHYRRYVAQRERRAAGEGGRPSRGVTMPAVLTRSEGPGHTVGLAPRGVNAGNGFLFVSHQGDVFPSGFLPLSVGNVRRLPLAEAYRSSDLFRRLRAPDLLDGRCGRCEYRQICGGSRSPAIRSRPIRGAPTGQLKTKARAAAHDPRAGQDGPQIRPPKCASRRGLAISLGHAS